MTIAQKSGAQKSGAQESGAQKSKRSGLRHLASGALLFGLALILVPSTSDGLDKSVNKRLQAAMAEVKKLDERHGENRKQIKEMVAVIKMIGKDNSSKAASLLLKLSLMSFKCPAAEVCIAEACKEALAGMNDPKVRKSLDKKIKKGGKRNYELQATLVEAYGYAKDDASQFLLHEMLLDSKNDERIVAAVARALVKRNDKRGVKPLIEAFKQWKKRGGATFRVIREALLAYTGKQFESTKEWEEFWDPRVETFEPNTQRSSSMAPRLTGSVERKAPTIFGSEVVSHKFVLIIDVSGSMHIRDPGDINRDDGRRVATGKNKPKPRAPGAAPRPGDPDYKSGPCKFPRCQAPNDHDGNLPINRMRIQRLKFQVRRMLKALPKGAQLNIIKFARDAEAYKRGKLVPASNKGAIMNWVDSMLPAGCTQTYLGVVEAFKIKEADTFYLISDGTPTDMDGKPLSKGKRWEIIQKVKQLNRLRRAKVHTIGLRGANGEFMRGLARATGGVYREVK